MADTFLGITNAVNVPASHEITGHKSVREALRNTEKYSSDLQGDADVRDYRQIPLEVDPPRHHLYRAALAPYFVKPTIEKMAPDFRKNSQEFIDQVLPSGTDIVSTFALPLVMRNLGVIYNRPQDVAEWISWGTSAWTAGGPERNGDILHRHLDAIYEEAINDPKKDIWHEIARLEIEGRVITHEEFRGIASVILAGGRDTVVKLITGAIWHFGRNPDDFEYLRQNPDRIDAAIQELLRFLTPNPAMVRSTVPESTVKELPDDRYVQISFLSGNFDETVFENPFEPNIRRERNPHVSFGFGPHTCIGNHVTEIEARVFIQTLLDSGISWEISESSKIHFYSGPMASVPAEFESLYVRIR
jgi:cytochrome P450